MEEEDQKAQRSSSHPCPHNRAQFRGGELEKKAMADFEGCPWRPGHGGL